jgi:hypothetical protein
MAAISTVFGFFYKIGSPDYPLNYDPNKPFGFNVDSTIPIFKYSINDVEKSLLSCRTLVKHSHFHGSVDDDNTTEITSSNIILVDSSGGYKAIEDEDITTDRWKDVFKITEFLYNNQSKVPGQPNDSKNYTSWADEKLKEGSVESNPFYCQYYIKNSLGFKVSSYSRIGRLDYVMFSVQLEYGNVKFTLYFDADAFVERADNIIYKVYRYEDLNNDNIISAQEMKTQIAEEMFKILHEGKFKTIQEYFIDKRISDDDFVREQFFIYSTLDREIDDSSIKLAIKKYLIDKYNNDLTYLRYTYPTLFDENEIRLIPIYDNLIESVSGQTSSVLYPLSIERLEKELRTFGYDIITSGSNYRPAEVFHVGPGAGAGWSGANSYFSYIFPIIAVEQQSESGVLHPISDRFPSYVPIYGPTSEAASDLKLTEFHSILVTILQYLMGIFTQLNDDFINEYDIVELSPGQSEGGNTSGGSSSIINRKRLSFIFDGNLWFIYGPISAGG